MCCYYKVDRDFAPGETIPVGRPFPNTEILLLNEKNERASTRSALTSISPSSILCPICLIW